MSDQQSTPAALPEAESAAAMKFAMDMLNGVPKDNPQALEAHLVAVLVLFWGALWGTLGTEYARDFIEAQLRGMEADVPHDRFHLPRKH